VLARASSSLTSQLTTDSFCHTDDDDICVPYAFIISVAGTEFSLNYLLGNAFQYALLMTNFYQKCIQGTLV
jgi:hypothetical protein